MQGLQASQSGNKYGQSSLLVRCSVLRIAYCMLVYKNPEQVSRLIERIYSPSDYFYVHRDKRREGVLRKYGRCPSDERWEGLLRKYRNGNVLFASKYKTPRCSFKVVEGVLDAMNYCRHFDYDYFVFLSGQCYPIKPVSKIKDELARRSVAYMEYFRLPSSHWEGENAGLDRIRYYHIATGDERCGIRIPRLNRTLPYGLQPYGGGYHCCLPRRFVEYVQDYVSNHPKIISFYRYCWMPAEMFFHTIIMNSALKCDVVNDHRWYIRWLRRGHPRWLGHGHPAILRKEDFNDIMRSDKLFARKFDISIDRDVLDLIDREIQRD